jgi:hypothetical protein
MCGISASSALVLVLVLNRSARAARSSRSLMQADQTHTANRSTMPITGPSRAPANGARPSGRRRRRPWRCRCWGGGTLRSPRRSRIQTTTTTTPPTLVITIRTDMHVGPAIHRCCIRRRTSRGRGVRLKEHRRDCRVGRGMDLEGGGDSLEIV